MSDIDRIRDVQRVMDGIRPQPKDDVRNLLHGDVAPTEGVWVSIDSTHFYRIGSTSDEFAVGMRLLKLLIDDGHFVEREVYIFRRIAGIDVEHQQLT